MAKAWFAAAAALVGRVQRFAGLAQIAARGRGQRIGKALPAGAKVQQAAPVLAVMDIATRRRPSPSAPSTHSTAGWPGSAAAA